MIRGSRKPAGATQPAAIERHPSIAYIAPFAIFIALLAVDGYLAFLGRWDFVVRVGVLVAALWFFSRHVITFQAEHWAGSLLLGVGVFLVWIAPDALLPGYRSHWLFQNGFTGQLSSSIPPGFLSDRLVLLMRSARAVLLVPIIEELFWRAWMMRWLIHHDFRSVPLGAYTAMSMWITAILFASEHGPYWDVGLAAGLLYNWWMVRTRSLGDCILAHATTNACLSGYVVATAKWEYWL